MPAVEVARLNNSALPQGVLRYIWAQMLPFRPVLLDWLVELGLSSQSEARIRAGTAAAFLAELEYETVLNRVLERWVAVAATNREARQSLAYALGSLVLAGRYTDATFILLANWAAGKELGRVWAATRAYGVIGPAYPGAAMEGWLDILARYDYLKEVEIEPALRIKVIRPDLARFFTSLLEAITSFCISGLTQPRADFVRIYAAIVTTLRKRLDKDDDGGLFTLTVLIIVLGLMNLRIDVDVAPAAEGDEATLADAGRLRGDRAPALLVLVHNLEAGAPAVDHLAALLGRLIRQQETRRAVVHGALHDWLVYIQQNKDEQLFVALRRVIEALIAQEGFDKYPRWRREVGRPLEQWAARRTGRGARPNEPPLPMAARLLREVPHLQNQ